MITREFQILNYIEAAVWCCIAAIALILALRASGAARSDAVLWAITLILFGASDVMESQTGAWWRPWWLLAWKAACLLVMLVLIVRWARRRRRATRATGATRGDST